MKARVNDPAALLARLPALGAIRVRGYHKEDRYFRSPSGQDVRIRLDGGEAFVTFKDKRLSAGLEINDEHEFTVSDATTMAALIERLGASLLIEKVKDGESWHWNGLLLEVSEVRGLGHFIELEVVTEIPEGLDPAQLEQTRQAAASVAERQIRQSLPLLGLSESDIEEHPYTRLLLDRVGKAPD